MENPITANFDGGTAWRCAVIVRFFIADVLLESDSRAVCFGNFIRGKDGRGIDDDSVFEIHRKIFVLHACDCSIHRLVDFYGFYFAAV